MRGLSLLQMAPGTDSACLPQHPDEHRPQCPVFLAVDQHSGEGAALGVVPELTDPVGSVEVGGHQDVKQLRPGSRTESIEPIAQDSLDVG